MSNANDTTMNDEVLVDETLDDLADLPASQPFPAGAHLTDMFLMRQKDKPATIIAKFKYKSNMELVNPQATSPNAGDECTLFIHTKKKDGTVNEFGQGQFKMLIAPIAERTGIKSINQLIEATKDGVEVAIVTGMRKSKDEGYPDQMAVVKCMLT